MSGNITRRGAHSWRLKYEGGERDPATGRRRTVFATVRGTKKQAQERLTQLLAARDNGTAVAPDKVTIAEYVRGWIAGHPALAPKTRERYSQLAEGQIVPHIGSIALQKLRPQQIADWHTTLLKSGSVLGTPLSPRTVRDANTLLRTVLQQATRLEVVGRNVALAVRPPRASAPEVQILPPEQVAEVLDKLIGHELRPIVALALATGMRRGELVALVDRL
jgi:integrase